MYPQHPAGLVSWAPDWQKWYHHRDPFDIEHAQGFVEHARGTGTTYREQRYDEWGVLKVLRAVQGRCTTEQDGTLLLKMKSSVARASWLGVVQNLGFYALSGINPPGSLDGDLLVRLEGSLQIDVFLRPRSSEGFTFLRSAYSALTELYGAWQKVEGAGAVNERMDRSRSALGMGRPDLSCSISRSGDQL